MAKALQESEKQKFYELIFCNIKEEDFACLYSGNQTLREKINSSPNAPVKCLVSALILQHRQKFTFDGVTENQKLKVRSIFKAEIFAFAVGISVNFERIYRYHIVRKH